MMSTSVILRDKLAFGLIFALAAALLLLAAAPAAADTTSWNVLTGAGYLSSHDAHSSYPDSGESELTDGVYASNLLADPAWQGRYGQTEYSFVIDMGSERFLQSFKANFFKYTGAAVYAPLEVEFHYSQDGYNYTEACSVGEQGASVDVTAVMYSCSAAEPFSASHLKLVVRSAPDTWSFIDEWEAITPEFHEPKLSGAFLQPQLGDTWTDTEWDNEFRYMQEVGMGHLILQWSADSGDMTAVYPTSLPGFTQSTSRDVVGKALEMGDTYGFDIYIGLQLNHEWFGKYANDVSWLSGEADIAVDLVGELWDLYGDHESFKGWYLSFEVDNYNLPTPTEWQRMVDFYDEIIAAIDAESPGLPVMIAPFYNAKNPLVGLQPSGWQTMWEYILSRTDIDIIALQDGVGVDHATTGDLAAWFAATKAAIDNASPGTELWSDTETLNLDFQPMDLQMVLDDMLAVEDYVTNFTSFSFNHYISPQQVNPLYYATYKEYVLTGEMDDTAPSAPTSLSASAVDSMTISLSWSASSDDTGVVGYKIYRNSELVYTGYSAATSFVDGQLEPGTHYTYQVLAFDAAGNESALSSSASATTPAGTTYSNNLAYGRPYTASMPADSQYPDSGGTELTDGVFGAISFADGAWQGRVTGAIHSFTIDLGSSQTIKEVFANFMQVKGSSVFLPVSVEFAVSDDNVSFTPIGTVNKPAVSDSDQTKKYRLTDLSGVSGRFVKVTITPYGSAWTFIDEIEVRN